MKFESKHSKKNTSEQSLNEENPPYKKAKDELVPKIDEKIIADLVGIPISTN